MEQYVSLIMILVMLGLMYLLMIRPENKRKKETEEMRNGVKKGDQITTIGGIIGRVVMVGEETLVIETSDDRVRMEITKWAISTNNTQAAAAAAAKGKKSAAEPEKIESDR